MKKIYLILILILHLLILSQLTFTAWPEMLTYPYLFSKGFTLYKDFILPYPPALPLILSVVFNLFGYSPYTLKIFTWVMIIIIDLLLYQVLKKITRKDGLSLGLLVVFVVWQALLDGNMLWFDIATVPFLLLALLFSLKWTEDESTPMDIGVSSLERDRKSINLFFTALCFSLAVFIKQIAIIYPLLILPLYWLKVKKVILNDLLYMLIGGGILIGMFIGYLLVSSSTIDFWRWAIVYPLFEWSKFPGYVNFLISKREIAISGSLLVTLFISLILTAKRSLNSGFYITLVFFIGSIIAVYPRFSFFHLQPVLVFLIITISSLLVLLPKNGQIKIFFCLAVVSLIVVFLTYQQKVGSGIRFYDQSEQRLTQGIKQLTQGNQRIFLLGLNSSLYVFSQTLPPVNWSDNFGWYLEIPGVQEWVLSGFSQNLPQVILWKVPTAGLWYDLGTYQPEKIADFIQNNYQKTGMINSGIEVWTRKR